MRDLEEFIIEEYVAIDLKETQVMQQIFNYARDSRYIISSDTNHFRIQLLEEYDINGDDIAQTRDLIVVSNYEDRTIKCLYINIIDTWFKVE